MGVTEIEIDILTSKEYPKQISNNKPLETALNEIKVKLTKILEREGSKLENVKEVKLTFTFNFKEHDHYCSTCKASLISTDGKVYERTVNCMGNTINT